MVSITESVRLESPSCRQIMAGRVALGWGQKELAHQAGVSLSSIRKLEALSPDDEPLDFLRPAIIIKIVKALENAGVEFQYEPERSRVGISFFQAEKPS